MKKHLLSSQGNLPEDQKKSIVDSIKNTMLKSLDQKIPEDPKDQHEFIRFVKDTIQSVFRSPQHYNEKEIIIDRLKHTLNETIWKNSEEFEELLQDNEEIIYLQIKSNKEDIINWNIEDSDDIIALIKQEDSLVNTVQNIINKSYNRNSILKEILKPIEQQFLSTENSDEYNQIISREIKKELEYITINKLLNFNKQQLQKKRNWCKNALYYIQHEFLYGQDIEPIKSFDKWWETYYWTIIDKLLEEKSSLHEIDYITLNKKTLAEWDDTMPSEHLQLFEKRCKAVIYENPRKEHKLGKDIIRELWTHKISLTS